MNDIIKIDDFFYYDITNDMAFRRIYDSEYDSGSDIVFYTDNIYLLKYNIYKIFRNTEDVFKKQENCYIFRYIDNIDCTITSDLFVKNRSGYIRYEDDYDNECNFYYMFELPTLSDIAKFKMLVD